MAALRWLPPLEIPLSPQTMARLWAGLKLGMLAVAAFSLALFTAFEALIDEAGLAGLTAAMLSMPNSGAVIAKSYARIVGCLLGGSACVVLFWVFPQAPWLFAAGMAVWLGICAFWGGKLKYFASYASILSGWTAVVVASDTHIPTEAMRIAGERVSVFLIGILAVMFVFSVMHVRKGFKVYLPSLREMNDRIIAQVRQVINDPESYDHVATMQEWAKDIAAINQRLEYGGAEDPEVALHTRAISCGLNDFFADIADFNIRIQQVGLLLRDSPDKPIADEVHREILAAFDARLQETDRQATERIAAIQQRVLTLFAAQTASNLLDRTRLLAEVHAAGELIDAMNLVRRGRETFDEDDIRPLGRAASFGHNFYNAAVVVFTFLVAWGVFIVNEWQPSGMNFIIVTTIYLLMVSITEDPVGKMTRMLPGFLGGIVAGLLCQQVLLPLGSGFPWLMLSFAVTIIIPGSILRVFPRTADAGNQFILFGMFLSMPDNQMNYDLQLFLNNGLAFFAAAMLTLASVLIFYPGRNRDKARWTERYALRELMQISHFLRLDRFAMWEDRQQERIGRINDIDSLKGTIIARESIQALLIMMRIARCFRRQKIGLEGIELTDALTRLIGQVDWFWSRQMDRSQHFGLMAMRLVDALVYEAKKQPIHELPLLAAAQEWRMISENNAVLRDCIHLDANPAAAIQQ